MTEPIGTCPQCSGPVMPQPARPHRREKKFCSDSCARAWRRAQRNGLFWAQVDRTGGPDACWPWTGARRSSGYGRFGRGGERTAHRIAWILTHGPIEGDLFVCHRCDNKPCCNPAHLFLGTNSDNIIDASQKGRLNPAKGEACNLSRLTAAKVLEIRRRRAAGEPTRKLAADFDVSPNTIRRVVDGRCWASVTEGA